MTHGKRLTNAGSRENDVERLRNQTTVGDLVEVGQVKRNSLLGAVIELVAIFRRFKVVMTDVWIEAYT